MKEITKFTNKKPKQELSYSYSTSNPAPVTYQRKEGGIFVCNIFGYIEEPEQYEDLIAALEIMDESDEMIINLQSGGGSVPVTDMIVHALRKTKGHVHFVATGQIASAATILLLEAHSFELSENFSALLHSGSLGEGGTLSEFRQAAPFHIKQMEKLIRNTYTGFLTEQEIEDMLDGKDLWLESSQWLERSEARNDWYKSETQKITDAMNEQAEKEPDKNCPIPVKKAPVKRKPKTTKEV